MRNQVPAEPGNAPEIERDLLPRLGHELRTPVQVIVGFVELLLAEQAGPLTADQRRYLEEVRRSGARLARFASELGAGAGAVSHPVRRERASLAHLAESVRASLKPLLDRRRQTLRVCVAPGAEQGWFDPARVEQVLENLIANASEHGPEGGAIDLGAERVEEPAGPALRVSVIDDGAGLAAGPPTAPGRGLGLAICRAIVAAHGGRFEVDRAPGRGARVRFGLPLPPEDAW